MLVDSAVIKGKYVFTYWDKHGELRWAKIIRNVVCTLGKNLALNSFLAGVNYTVTGPYLGLITGTGFTGVAASDTMAAHPGWTEANSAGLRQLCVWSPASGGEIALASVLTFTFTGTDVIQGAFIGYGPGVVHTTFDPNGTLWSAGAFQGGAQPVALGGTLSVAYAASM
jgi:hypothetical protein